jgi:hypothetical protein
MPTCCCLLSASTQVIDTDAFEVVVVSPRNHFVFTPMLPSTAVGTVEFRWGGGSADWQSSFRPTTVHRAALHQYGSTNPLGSPAQTDFATGASGMDACCTLIRPGAVSCQPLAALLFVCWRAQEPAGAHQDEQPLCYLH